MNTPEFDKQYPALRLHRRGAVLHCVPLLPITLAHSREYETVLTAVQRLCEESPATLTPISEALISFAEVSDYDSYCVVWLEALKRLLTANNVRLNVENLTPTLRQFITTLEPTLSPISVKQPEPKVRLVWLREPLTTVGETIRQLAADFLYFVRFIGELLYVSTALLRRKSGITSLPRGELTYQMTRAGVYAVPIVALIGFLVGVIVAYQGAMQLRQFGAEIYVADMVAISLCRELAPLMTAIIVAGRSGAAFAAEIGTMRVSEETDALETMGFNTMSFLVLPRIIAVMAVIPVLTLFADLAGMAGGMMIGISVSRLSIAGYINETQVALTLKHLLSGLGKSFALGGLIALIGCMRGLQVQGGAESVGRYTTSAVVTGIFCIIVADVLFTLVFQALGM